MFSSCSSSLLSSLFSSSSPIFPSAAPFPSNLAFVVPSSASSSSSVPSSALSDVFHTLSLQLLLDQHRNSLLRSILSLTSTVPVSDSFYSNPNDYTQKDESLVKEEEETEQGTAGGAEWRKLEEEKTETEIRRGKKRKGRDRGEMAEERRPRGDGAKRTRNDPSKRRVFRPQKGEAETDSPVSGMFIKEFCDEEELRQATAELDESAQFVHVTEETREAISAIPNVIGDSICALCKIRFVDVFRLAMHKCPRIRHAEYRCDECEKVFSCPANLASHRRWHRPSGKKPYEQFAEFTRQKKGKTKAKSGRENGKRQKRERHWAQAEKTTESQTPAATFKF